MQKSALMIGEYGSNVMRPYSLVLGFRSASIFLMECGERVFGDVLDQNHTTCKVFWRVT
jgi:hypothetical protein